MRVAAVTASVLLCVPAAFADGLPASFAVTVTPAAPLAAVPSGTVSRTGLMPVPGASVSSHVPSVPAYDSEPASSQAVPAVLPLPDRIPVPEPNPLAVSFCEMDFGL